MLIDANHLGCGQAINSAVAIVGGGPAGIALALQLAQKRIDVALFESGGVETDRVHDLFNGSIAPGSPHAPANTFRERGLGGTTAVWGGRCVPMDPIDFVERPYVPLSGWPLSYEAITRYYPAALELCDGGAFDFNATSAFADKLLSLAPGLMSEVVDTNGIERFSPPSRFGKKFRRDLDKNPHIRVYCHATCNELYLSDSQATITGLHFQTDRGKTITARAKLYVLANGGIEIPRLLLNGNLGKTSDMIGRCYSGHIRGSFGRIRFAASPERVAYGYEKSKDGVWCRRRFSFTAKAQENLHLLNTIFRLDHPDPADPSHHHPALSAMFLAKRFILYEYSRRMRSEKTSLCLIVRHLHNIAVHPIALAKFLSWWVRERHMKERAIPSVVYQSRGNDYALEINAEQTPNPESRLRLTKEKDSFGLRRVLIDWKCTSQDIESAVRAFSTLKRELATSGTATLDYDPEEIADGLRKTGLQDGHHLGATRMAMSPKEGVVDSDCRVFGVENLFIASPSVFPTSSHANPTLTLLSLSLRLADHLSTITQHID